MTSVEYDVVGIGNAIVDVLAQAEDDFLVAQGLTKGSMALVDTDEATALYERMAPGVECSGGSAANSMAGIASLGSRAAFIGKVHDDQLGEVFRHDLRGIGVRYDTPAAEDGPPTARCMILVTPDAQRTMNTFLGASADLTVNDIDTELVARSAITYLEGYLWDPPQAKEAFRRAMATAKAAGRKVALTLSDSFCVDRFRAEFIEIVETQVDILFANEAEITSLYQAADFDEALQHVRGHCEIAALTRSDKGSVIVAGDVVHVIDPVKLGPLVDTTGAGDLYAAGFLHGLAHGNDLHRCGQIASVAAGEIITHYGARPEADLGTLIKEKLG